MSNTPSRTDMLSGFMYVRDDDTLADLNGNTMRLSDVGSGTRYDVPSDNGALLDWMSAEGLLEHVTTEANCE